MNSSSENIVFLKRDNALDCKGFAHRDLERLVDDEELFRFAAAACDLEFKLAARRVFVLI